MITVKNNKKTYSLFICRISSLKIFNDLFHFVRDQTKFTRVHFMLKQINNFVLKTKEAFSFDYKITSFRLFSLPFSSSEITRHHCFDNTSEAFMIKVKK